MSERQRLVIENLSEEEREILDHATAYIIRGLRYARETGQHYDWEYLEVNITEHLSKASGHANKALQQVLGCMPAPEVNDKGEVEILDYVTREVRDNGTSILDPVEDHQVLAITRDALAAAWREAKRPRPR